MPPSKPVILVVEDDEKIAFMLQTLLELEGYSAEIATDGLAGLERIEAGGVDLVLLDIRLPGMDGLDLCREVRAWEDRPYIPIIMVTGEAGAIRQSRGFAAGADDYIVKPFIASNVMDRIRVWLRVGERMRRTNDGE